MLGTPATATVTITDDDVIDTAVTSGPEGPTNDPTPTFSFTATPADGATFECAVDDGAFAACTVPHTTGPLPDGPHVFRVRAVSPTEARDASPATRAFFVDTVAPTARLTIAAQPGAGREVRPGVFIGRVSVTRSISDPEPSPGGGGIQCTFDPPAPPQSFEATNGDCPIVTDAPGRHSVYAAAYDAAGNRQASIASASFEILGPPDTTITSGPAASGYLSTPSFSFTSDVAGSTFRCRLDGIDRPCSSPYVTPELTQGGHLFSVTAISPDGAEDPTPATWVFVIEGTKTAGTQTCRIELFPQAESGGTSERGCEWSRPGVRLNCDIANLKSRWGCDRGAPACPRGARCTTIVESTFNHADGPYDWEMTGTSGWHGTAFGGERRFIATIAFCKTFLTLGGDNCSKGLRVSHTWFGGGDRVPRAECGVKGGPVGVENLRNDAARRLRCTFSMTVGPATALEVSTFYNQIGVVDFVDIFLPSAGSLDVTAGGRTRAATARRVTLKATEAGPVTFRPRLSRGQKRILRRKRKLALRLQLAFTPADGGERLTGTRRAVLRRPPKTARTRYCAKGGVKRCRAKNRKGRRK